MNDLPRVKAVGTRTNPLWVTTKIEQKSQQNNTIDYARPQAVRFLGDAPHVAFPTSRILSLKLSVDEQEQLLQSLRLAPGATRQMVLSN
jgi:hypothetical protein